MVSRLAPFQHAFVQRLSELGVAYRGSPIVEGAGERHWDDSIRGGEGIRSRFLLLVDESADPSVTKAAREITDSMPQIVELRSRPGRDIRLVRPDGYVAYAAAGDEGTTPLKEIRALLERQTTAIHADAARMKTSPGKHVA